MVASQNRFERATELRPKFNLTGNGAFGQLRRQACIEQVRRTALQVGPGLISSPMAAFCYRRCKSQPRQFQFTDSLHGQKQVMWISGGRNSGRPPRVLAGFRWHVLSRVATLGAFDPPWSSSSSSEEPGGGRAAAALGARSPRWIAQGGRGLLIAASPMRGRRTLIVRFQLSNSPGLSRPVSGAFSTRMTAAFNCAWRTTGPSGRQRPAGWNGKAIDRCETNGDGNSK